MSALDLVILGLASHRIWMVWFYSKFSEALRVRMGNRGGWWAYFAGCELCVSVWCGFAGTAIWYYAYWLAVGLAGGGLVFFVQPAVELLKAVALHKNAEVARIRAELEIWQKRG